MRKATIIKYYSFLLLFFLTFNMFGNENFNRDLNNEVLYLNNLIERNEQKPESAIYLIGIEEKTQQVQVNKKFYIEYKPDVKESDKFISEEAINLINNYLIDLNTVKNVSNFYVYLEGWSVSTPIVEVNAKSNYKDENYLNNRIDEINSKTKEEFNDFVIELYKRSKLKHSSDRGAILGVQKILTNVITPEKPYFFTQYTTTISLGNYFSSSYNRIKNSIQLLGDEAKFSVNADIALDKHVQVCGKLFQEKDNVKISNNSENILLEDYQWEYETTRFANIIDNTSNTDEFIIGNPLDQENTEIWNEKLKYYYKKTGKRIYVASGTIKGYINPADEDKFANDVFLKSKTLSNQKNATLIFIYSSQGLLEFKGVDSYTREKKYYGIATNSSIDVEKIKSDIQITSDISFVEETYKQIPKPYEVYWYTLSSEQDAIQLVKSTSKSNIIGKSEITQMYLFVDPALYLRNMFFILHGKATPKESAKPGQERVTHFQIIIATNAANEYYSLISQTPYIPKYISKNVNIKESLIDEYHLQYVQYFMHTEFENLKVDFTFPNPGDLPRSAKIDVVKFLDIVDYAGLATSVFGGDIVFDVIGATYCYVTGSYKDASLYTAGILFEGLSGGALRASLKAISKASVEAFGKVVGTINDKIKFAFGNDVKKIAQLESLSSIKILVDNAELISILKTFDKIQIDKFTDDIINDPKIIDLIISDKQTLSDWVILGNQASTATLATYAQARKLCDPALLKQLDDAVYQSNNKTQMIADLKNANTTEKVEAVVRGANELTDVFINGWTKEKILDKVKELKAQGKSLEITKYLDAKDIAEHLSKFDEGVSCLKLESNLVHPNIGFDDGLFVLPKSEMDALLAKTGGDISLIEKELGIPNNAWKQAVNDIDKPDKLVRIDIDKAENLRMANGNEQSANNLWVPGGKTSGGYSEAVINPIPVINTAKYKKTPIILK